MINVINYTREYNINVLHKGAAINVNNNELILC